MNLVLEFTPDEVNALKQLCDVALRSNGLGALEVAKHFTAKLSAAEVAASTSEPKKADATTATGTAD